MKIAVTHQWSLTPAEARQLQDALRSRVIVKPEFPTDVRTVAGVDVGFVADVVRAAVVILSYPGLELLECGTATEPVSFPYVPGLLSFREAPVILRAAAGLACEPDLIFVDGHGLAHPRRFGIASHLGVALDKPTIGCAKSRLVGEHAAPGPNVGDREYLSHQDEIIGGVLRTKHGSKPVYVSIGHRIDLETAIEFSMAALRGYRLPEPVRMAHLAASGRLPC